MKKISLYAIILSFLFVNAFAGAATYIVPSMKCPTLFDAVTEANKDAAEDIIKIIPNSEPYSLSAGLADPGILITEDLIIQSLSPEDPASVILDGNNSCRAFTIKGTGTVNCTIEGITFQNFFAAGAVGTDGADVPFNPGQAIAAGNTPPHGRIGKEFTNIAEALLDPEMMLPALLWYTVDSDGDGVNDSVTAGDAGNDGYGGAIDADNAILIVKNCVFKNCKIAGAKGGDGALGYSVPLAGDDSLQGANGGHGGAGVGDGFGGAISMRGCLTGSLIENCTFESNIAKGGIGGNGGNGGNSGSNAYTSRGGDAGPASGYGYGGSLFVAAASDVIVRNCSFNSNQALPFKVGEAGMPGAGKVDDEHPAIMGWTPPSPYTSDGLGGAIFCNAALTIENCSFDENSAFGSGGAIYMKDGTSSLHITDTNDELPTFSNNLAGVNYDFGLDQITGERNIKHANGSHGGAICFEGNAVQLTLESADGCLVFVDNAAPFGNGGAINAVNLTSESDGTAVAKATGCVFSNNSAGSFEDDQIVGGRGGAIHLEKLSQVDFTNTSFSSNSALRDGGALCVNSDTSSAASTVNFANCSITANTVTLTGSTGGSGTGGAISAYKLVGSFTNSYINQNSSLVGGGLYLEECDDTLTFDKCKFIANEAVSSNSSGGAVNLINSYPQFADCEFVENLAGGSAGCGGAIYALINDPGNKIIIFNCLFDYNQAVDNGGAYYGAYTGATFTNCTIANNGVLSPLGRGGAIYLDDIIVDGTEVKNSIFDTNIKTSIYATKLANLTLSYNLFFIEDLDTDPTNLAPNQALVGDDLIGDQNGIKDINGLVAGGNNTYGNPNFIDGPLGKYYLCTSGDNQSLLALNIVDEANPFGADYVSDEGEAQDIGFVDLGYHHLKSTSLTPLTLSFEPNENATIGYVVEGGSTPISAPKTFYPGTLVDLKVIPKSGWAVDRWIGTDADSSNEKENTVVMNMNRTVGIAMRQLRVLHVPTDNYSSLQQAIDDSQDGDTIVLEPGIYTTANSYVINNKAITITSKNPDDPSIVAATVITQEVGPGGGVGNAFEFGFCDNRTVLNGITIKGFHIKGLNGIDGKDAGDPGVNGGKRIGPAIICVCASPIISNCVIEDCTSLGGDGGNGAGGGNGLHGGHGGWPGYAFGAGLACLSSNFEDFSFYFEKSENPLTSNPIVRNCTFRDLHVTGGNGGNGGDGTDDPWTRGGLAGGWYYSQSDLYGRYFSHNGIQDRFTQDENSDYIFHWPYEPTDGYREYNFYTGKGGAVYVDEYCSPEFYNCIFEENTSQGGTCGVCGANGVSHLKQVPNIHYKIDNGGGAVYIYGKSNAKFEKCTFKNNTAYTDIPVDNDDEYVSFGGALYVEDDSDIQIVDCNFIGNTATVGGAIYNDSSSAELSDVVFNGNTAYLGGGSFLVDCLAENLTGNGVHYLRCMIEKNTAQIPDDLRTEEAEGDEDAANPSLPFNRFGSGGGVYCWGSDAKFYDTELNGNTAELSGGGYYFGGSHSPMVFNNLIVNNAAGRDGGGISSNWNAQVDVRNSTIAYNSVIGADFLKRYGGGIYCSYEAYTSIIDSIVWGNSADSDCGKQLAVGTSFEFDKRPATLDVKFSDVQGGKTGVYHDTGDTTTAEDDCILLWDDENPDGTAKETSNFNEAPLFVTDPNQTSDYYLSNADVEGQTQTSPCWNKGSTQADNLDSELMLAYYRHSTRTDREMDQGTVDVGYHVVLRSDLRADINYDYVVNGEDLTKFIPYWLEDGCDFPYWCYERDINRDSRVNTVDLAILNADIHKDKTPPFPRKMEWETVPYSNCGTTYVKMCAVTARDNTGCEITYIVNYGCCDPNYPGETEILQDGDPFFEVEGLVKDRDYWFEVSARDQSVNPDTGLANTTAPSDKAYVKVGADNEPPMPNPLGWSIEPRPLSETSIEMQAQTATDASGVEYYFQCVSGGGHDSGWQDSPTYVDENLTAGTEYSYAVCARDKSQFQNRGEYSEAALTATLGGGSGSIDYYPPTTPPAPYGYMDSFYHDANRMYHLCHNLEIPVGSSTDNSGTVYFEFICKDDSSFNSPKITAGMYEGDVLNTGYYKLWIADDKVKYRVFIGYVGTYFNKIPLEWYVRVSDPDGNSANSPVFEVTELRY